MKKYNFDISDILTIGLVIVVTGIALAVGLQIMGEVRHDVENCPADYPYVPATGLCTHANTTTLAPSATGMAHGAMGDAVGGVAKLPEKLPLIATVVVAAIIIGILVRYLFVRLR